MKIYTGTGDEGETGLLGGRRVPKQSRRIHAYGEIDELNASLGWCARLAPDNLAEQLRREMTHLFVLGSHLATPARAPKKVRDQLPELDAGWVRQLERELDELQEELEPLHSFILPGGSELAARLHLARCICRRAERAVCELAASEKVGEPVLPYLNRLGDWLFVLARAANRAAGVADIPWSGRR